MAAWSISTVTARPPVAVSSRAASFSVKAAGFTRSVEGRLESAKETPPELCSRIHLFALPSGEKHALIHVVGRTQKGNDMRITRMTVEGAKGWANIAYRDVAGKQVIGIRGDGAAGILDLEVDTRDEQSQRYAAARLQRELDGYQGTAGDVADYLRAIQTFAD